MQSDRQQINRVSSTPVILLLAVLMPFVLPIARLTSESRLAWQKDHQARPDSANKLCMGFGEWCCMKGAWAGHARLPAKGGVAYALKNPSHEQQMLVISKIYL